MDVRSLGKYTTKRGYWNSLQLYLKLNKLFSLLLLLLLLLLPGHLGNYNYHIISSWMFQNQPNEICSHLSEKGSKGRFLKADKLQITVTKEKERRKLKEWGEGKEDKRKKAMAALLAFIIATLFLAEKNCWTQKVHLAITFSKIRLDLYSLGRLERL